MFRSTCTLAAPLAVVLATGCFIDGGGGGDGDTTATTGATTDDTGSSSTGPQITAGSITQTATDTTTGVSATGTDTTASTTQASTVSDSDPSSGTSDTDNGTETTPDTDTDIGSSSSTGDDTLSVEELVPGDLIITEVMANPNCDADNCEWFELYNATEFDIDLLNLGIGDRDNFENGTPGTFILVSAILPPDELGVIARQELWPYDESPEPLARYSNAVQLSNSTFEQVAVFSGNTVLDVSATFLPNEEAGHSRALRGEFWNGIDHTDSDEWCWSNTVLPSNSTSDDWGTPASDVVECLPPA